MSAKNKRFLKIYLPIFIIISVAAVVIILFVLNNKVSEKDYFRAVTDSEFTKQVQTTTIYDGEKLTYEKVEIIIIDGDNVYHKFTERKLSAELDKDYDVTTTEFYYSATKMYYFENNVWNSKDFDIKNSLKRFSFKKEYFETLSYDEEVKPTGKLNGKIKDSSIKNIINEDSFKDMQVEIVVNKKFIIQELNIEAKTSKNRDVKIQNNYSYNDEHVHLPI